MYFATAKNTTARIESTGEGNRIHLSQDTADHLVAANKGHWIKAREDMVSAKGKGLMATFWLNTKFKTGTASSSGGVSSERHTIDFGSASAADGDHLSENTSKVDRRAQEAKISAVNSRMERLVNWNVDVMLRVIKLIVARRASCPSGGDVINARALNSLTANHGKRTVIDEVQEIIHLPEFDAMAAQNQPAPDSIKLSGEVMSQLRKYVQVTNHVLECSSVTADAKHISHFKKFCS
jgi:Adenylate and Guanylate cyclase catalytic domain